VASFDHPLALHPHIGNTDIINKGHIYQRHSTRLLRCPLVLLRSYDTNHYSLYPCINEDSNLDSANH